MHIFHNSLGYYSRTRPIHFPMIICIIR
uniref:Uncharacterized protein n=1 Tax=Anguilla anguilla TaxID=7936 RepID=A0A0E9R3D0_ANGAN